MMEKGREQIEDANSRAERRKRDPIGQILDLLSNSGKSNTSEEKKGATSSGKKDVSSEPSKDSNRARGGRNFEVNSSVTTNYLDQKTMTLDESSAFKPFSKNLQEISNNIANHENYSFQNNIANTHMYATQNVSLPLMAASLYGIPGFPFQYQSIPNTVSHNVLPKMPFMFPRDYGLSSNYDTHRNMQVFSWLGNKLTTDSSFNPACILSSENSGSHVAQTPPRYQCEFCKKSYSTFGGLSKHKQFHCVNQVKKEFSCKFCGKCYGSLGALKMHIRTHTLPCKCKICGKAFSRPWLLQGHIRTHTGEKPFRCDHCSRAFADRSNLRAHLQTHSEVKKYGCKNCNKTFSRMSLLVKHKENHCYR